MIDPLLATAPQRHASVHASAGTGKTWLLVTRLLRLLLAGTAPENILAVTFTRKATAEMLQRLNERLAQLASGDDDAVDAALLAMGETPDNALRERARRLYENLLFAPHALRATTFHAFCQEVLQRFPVEAEVPPGFELLEAESELIDEAWDALYAEATLTPGSKIARALEALFDGCNGLGNTRQALNSFLQQRIDWWAYTRGHKDSLAHAETRSRAVFDLAADTDPAAQFFSVQRSDRLNEFAILLGKHANKTNLEHQASLLAGLEASTPAPERLAFVSHALLTGKGEPRVRKASKALETALGGSDNCAHFLELHETLCNELLDTHDQLARLAALALNLAWHRAGQRLLEHYQRIKREQRVLDFADLEWHTYRLLNGSEHAHWVQYKLDARIDHFLIDEFQDTNPTQWRLLLPLFEELAASAAERPRSVFLVGDAKQSIYRFRRADARLLEAASTYLETNLRAERFSLEASRRSAPAIIDAVNRAFSSGPLAAVLTDFPLHSTHHQGLWGQVELLPPLTQPDAVIETPRAGLRNPLREPRPPAAADLHTREAARLAQRIRELVNADTLIGATDTARPLRYGDILILLRTRTHASAYEAALRNAGIPYLGAARGTLLDSLEVRDLEALLNTLSAPHSNLALAQVLRSPLFAARDEDLITLAQSSGTSWMERLLVCGPTQASATPLARAARMLPAWQTMVGVLPVHDLLDRIYHQGDILKRFEAAATPALKPRVRANLTRFIELALEIDSGRYPSLPHFLTRLGELRQRVADAPDDAPPEAGAGDRVRFLTVHGAKGLEAPVVFLADCAGKGRDRNAWNALTDWPADQDRPETFLLVGRKDSRDRITQALLERQQVAEQRETANLLYVALTRARQMLIVSAAVTDDKADQGWYGILRAQWDTQNQLTTGAAWLHDSGRMPTQIGAEHINSVPAATSTPEIDPRLNQPLPAIPRLIRIAPSRSLIEHDIETVTDPDGRRRGIGIHRLLEWLTTAPARSRPQLLAGLARELQRDANDPELVEWLNEAEAVVHDPLLAALFDARLYAAVYAEVPLQYYAGAALVDGIIDRLLVSTDSAHIIDYKTHNIDASQASATAQAYRAQLNFYVQGVRKLWPTRHVRASILFTQCRVLVDVIE